MVVHSYHPFLEPLIPTQICGGCRNRLSRTREVKVQNSEMLPLTLGTKITGMNVTITS